MRLKVDIYSEGLHETESVVSVNTLERKEYVVVSNSSINDGTLEIGYPVRVDKENYLVELPRESDSGAWRVWVSRDAVVA